MMADGDFNSGPVLIITREYSTFELCELGKPFKQEMEVSLIAKSMGRGGVGAFI